MIKQVILIVIATVFSFNINGLGQTIKLTYSLAFSEDSLNFKNRKFEEVIVYNYNNQVSMSSTKDFFHADSLYSLLDKGLIDPYDMMGVDRKYNASTYFNILIKKDFVKDLEYVYESIYRNYYQYNQGLIKDWKLLEGDSLINSFKCKKAQCTYKGRNYTAWYAPDVPIYDGPWFFSGLPGLIIQISDSKNHYSFKISQLQELSDDKMKDLLIMRHKKLITAKREKVFELREYMRKDFLGFLNTNYGIRLLDGDIETKSVIEENAKKRNNPIELE